VLLLSETASVHGESALPLHVKPISVIMLIIHHLSIHLPSITILQICRIPVLAINPIALRELVKLKQAAVIH